MTAAGGQRSTITESSSSSSSIHHRLFEFTKSALLKIFVSPYATVCDLYCGKVGGSAMDKWDDAQIGHYIGIDVSSSGITDLKELFHSFRKTYTADFFHFDPSLQDVHPHLLHTTTKSADVICCLHQLQFVFETQDKARTLLRNVSSLLNPGGYFIGITPDSSTIWAKYQKNVEAYHNRSTSSIKPNIVPNCIRSENYVITFEVEEEKFPCFGKKYQIKFANEQSAETHCLVHFPSLIRSAREAGLDYIEIQNLTEFYDDNRMQLAGMLSSFGTNLVDPKGRLLPRSFDILGLYSTFIFQKPDPDIGPPMVTPLYNDSYNRDEGGEWQGTTSWRGDDEKSVQATAAVAVAEAPPPAAAPIPQGLGKISEQKGILGPGPPDLRYSEAM